MVDRQIMARPIKGVARAARAARDSEWSIIVTTVNYNAGDKNAKGLMPRSNLTQSRRRAEEHPYINFRENGGSRRKIQSG